MNLLFVIENLHPHASAGGYYAPFKFAQHLARRGHTVRVYAAQDLGWGESEGSFRVLYRPSLPRGVPIVRRIDRLLAAVGDRLLLEPETRRLRPDWVLGVFRESAIKAADLGRRHGIPVANFVYECPPWIRDVAGEARFRADYAGYHRRLWERTREAYLASAVLFPNSSLCARWMSRWLDGREIAAPIHPGVDETEMGPAAGAGEPEIAPGLPRVLHVGRLAPAKNVDRLLRAFLSLDVKAELHIAGTGPEERRLKRLASGRRDVVFHGYVPDRDLWTLYRRSALVVSPSSFEGFGMPPMQALYFRRPCLASDIPIYREVYGETLDYFPPGDEEALRREMRRLLLDPAYRLRRGEAGRAYVLSRFTWAEGARRIEETLAARRGDR